MRVADEDRVALAQPPRHGRFRAVRRREPDDRGRGDSHGPDRGEYDEAPEPGLHKPAPIAAGDGPGVIERVADRQRNPESGASCTREPQREGNTGTQRRVEHMLLERGIALERETKHRRERQQQRKDGEKAQ